MEPGLSLIKQHMIALNIPAAAGILDELLLEAQGNDFTYQEFLYQLVAHEVTTRKYANTTKATMRIKRKPGEMLEVDWAGKTAFITDNITGGLTPM